MFVCLTMCLVVRCDCLHSSGIVKKEGTILFNLEILFCFRYVQTLSGSSAFVLLRLFCSAALDIFEWTFPLTV